MTAEIALATRFPADACALRNIRTHVRETALKSGCSEAVAADLVVAVNEACMNIIQHAYKDISSGEIILEILNNGEELEIRLCDHAAPVDLAGIRPRALDDLRPGGLGTHFIRTIMDDCQYGHLEGGGNFLHMRKKIG